MDDSDFLDELFDIINAQPLTTSRFSEFEETIQLNQQIINNIYNIRRHFESEHFEPENIDNQGTFNSSDEEFDRWQGTFNSSDEEFYRWQGTFDYGEIIQNTLNDIFNINYTEQEFEDVKVTLTPEQFSKLKNEKITNENIDRYFSKPCNICMDNYNIDDEITFLVCNHCFHTNCIKHWLCNEKVSCPVCRKDNRQT
jgi:hypothetical protein